MELIKEAAVVPPQSAFLQQLKQQTAAQHAALEAQPCMRRLMTADVVLSDYVLFLQMMRPVLRAYEEVIVPQCSIYFPERNRENATQWIEHDLTALGADVAGMNNVASCSFDYLSQHPVGALGAMYVMEGSRLGGMVIYNHLHKRLPITQQQATYLTSNGAATAANWRAFVQKLADIATTQNVEHEVIDAAGVAFDLIRLHVQSNTKEL